MYCITLFGFLETTPKTKASKRSIRLTDFLIPGIFEERFLHLRSPIIGVESDYREKKKAGIEAIICQIVYSGIVKYFCKARLLVDFNIMIEYATSNGISSFESQKMFNKKKAGVFYEIRRDSLKRGARTVRHRIRDNCWWTAPWMV